MVKPPADVEQTTSPPRELTSASRSTIVRALFFLAGTIALGLGLLGIFLPLLPTTPLLLLATACYARSSDRAYAWLLRQPWAGPLIRQWREQRTIPRRAKFAALALVVASFTATFLFVPNCVYGYTLLGAIAVGLVIFLGGLETT